MDGYSYSGLGMDIAVPSTAGTNFQIYRTPDDKTYTLALHQVLGGDYAGTGPNRSGQWGLRFNLVRIFK